MLHESLARMNTDAHLKAKGFVLLAPPIQDLLNPYGSLQGIFRRLEGRHNGIPYSFDDLAAVPLNHRINESVV